MDDWLQSRELSPRDRASIDSRIEQIGKIEGDQNIPADWVDSYTGTNLHRLKKRGPQRKALRIVCHRDDYRKEIILFNGFVKKNKKLPKSVIEEAEKLLKEMHEGKGDVEDY